MVHWFALNYYLCFAGALWEKHGIVVSVAKPRTRLDGWVNNVTSAVRMVFASHIPVLLIMTVTSPKRSKGQGWLEYNN